MNPLSDKFFDMLNEGDPTTAARKQAELKAILDIQSMRLSSAMDSLSDFSNMISGMQSNIQAINSNTAAAAPLTLGFPTVAPAKPQPKGLTPDQQRSLILPTVGKLKPLFASFDHSVNFEHILKLKLSQFIDLSLLTFLALAVKQGKPKNKKPNAFMKEQADIVAKIANREWKDVDQLLVTLVKDVGLPVERTVELKHLAFLIKLTDAYAEPIAVTTENDTNAKQTIASYTRKVIQDISPHLFTIHRHMGGLLEESYNEHVRHLRSQKSHSRTKELDQGVQNQVRYLSTYASCRFKELEQACRLIGLNPSAFNTVHLLELGKRITHGFTNRTNGVQGFVDKFENEIVLGCGAVLSEKAKQTLENYKELLMELGEGFLRSLLNHLKEAKVRFPLLKNLLDSEWEKDLFGRVLVIAGGAILNNIHSGFSGQHAEMNKKNNEDVAKAMKAAASDDQYQQQIEEFGFAVDQFCGIMREEWTKRLGTFYQEKCLQDFNAIDSSPIAILLAGIALYLDDVKQQGIFLEGMLVFSGKKTLEDRLAQFLDPKAVQSTGKPKDDEFLFNFDVLAPMKAHNKKSLKGFLGLYLRDKLHPDSARAAKAIDERLKQFPPRLNLFAGPIKLLCERALPLLEAGHKASLVAEASAHSWWMKAIDDVFEEIAEADVKEAAISSDSSSASHAKSHKSKKKKAQNKAKVVVTKASVAAPITAPPPVAQQHFNAYPDQTTRFLASFRASLENYNRLPKAYNLGKVVPKPAIPTTSIVAAESMHQYMVGIDCVNKAVEMYQLTDDMELRDVIAHILFLWRHIDIEQMNTQAAFKSKVKNPFVHSLSQQLEQLKITGVSDRTLWAPEDTFSIRFPIEVESQDLPKMPFAVQLFATEDTSQKQFLQNKLNKELNTIARELAELQIRVLKEKDPGENASALPDLQSLLKEESSAGKKAATTTATRTGISLEATKMLSASRTSLESVAKELSQVIEKEKSALKPSASAAAVSEKNAKSASEKSARPIPGSLELQTVGQRVLTLKKIHKHLILLSALTKLFERLPEEHFQFVQVHAFLFFSQYAVENIGMYLSQKHNDEVRLHHFESYQSFGLDQPIAGDKKLMKAFDELNLRKFSEYIVSGFRRTQEEGVSSLLHYLAGVFATSRAATLKREGVPVADDANRLSLSQMQCELAVKFADYTKLVVTLVQGHLCGS